MEGDGGGGSGEEGVSESRNEWEGRQGERSVGLQLRAIVSQRHVFIDSRTGTTPSRFPSRAVSKAME